ncbi:MAG: cell division protein ZapA [Nitrospinota bacterium]|nr:cell division protein ZapA [Nitrospinota bacterium]
MKEGKRVSVTVYGMELSIVSSEDPAKTRQYAEYVDKLMRDIASRIGGHTELNRVAVLALLQIAHDLFTLREQVEQDRQAFDARMGKLLTQIDAAVSLSGVQTRIGETAAD